MNKRIFIALPVSPELHPRISEFQNKYSNLPIRWITHKNLHVTVIPPWEESNPKSTIEKIKRHFDRGVNRVEKSHNVNNPRMMRFLDYARNDIQLIFTSISFGPNPREPRLIWVSGETPRELIKLKQSLENLLGQRPEHRHFQTHITLARFRSEDFYRFPIKKLNEIVDWQFRADSFVLMESHLSSKGADYEILAHMHL